MIYIIDKIINTHLSEREQKSVVRYAPAVELAEILPELDDVGLKWECELAFEEEFHAIFSPP